jgi:hypothetical protein
MRIIPPEFCVWVWGCGQVCLGGIKDLHAQTSVRNLKQGLSADAIHRHFIDYSSGIRIWDFERDESSAQAGMHPNDASASKLSSRAYSN